MARNGARKAIKPNFQHFAGLSTLVQFYWHSITQEVSQYSFPPQSFWDEIRLESWRLKSPSLFFRVCIRALPRLLCLPFVTRARDGANPTVFRHVRRFPNYDLPLWVIKMPPAPPRTFLIHFCSCLGCMLLLLMTDEQLNHRRCRCQFRLKSMSMECNYMQQQQHVSTFDASRSMQWSNGYVHKFCVP